MDNKEVYEGVYTPNLTDIMVVEAPVAFQPTDAPKTSIQCILEEIVMEVRRTMGSGYHESIYQKAVETELRLRGISYESQPVIPIFYKTFNVGFHRPDLIVEGQIIVELKSTRSQSCVNAERQLDRYLQTTSHNVGALVVFGDEAPQVLWIRK
jgi:GxxExxY protein